MKKKTFSKMNEQYSLRDQYSLCEFRVLKNRYFKWQHWQTMHGIGNETNEWLYKRRLCQVQKPTSDLNIHFFLFY